MSGGASCALVGRGTAYRLRFEPREPRKRVEKLLFDEPRIDDGADAWDGERAFGDVCREDEAAFAAGWARQNGGLILDRQ